MNENQILLYQTESGDTHLEVLHQDETVWLTQRAMAQLFQKDISTINEHIKNIYREGELDKDSTIGNFPIVQKEGGREVSRKVTHYNLDAIISVGYRVNSKRGTQFRIWATQKLTEFIKKGFVMNDDRLAYGDSKYFSELEERIRRIRTSEINFHRKVREVFTTSYDYDGRSDQSKMFFATVQNKFHYATHGHTAAELILERVGKDKRYMGLTNWRHDTMSLQDALVAKNYLTELELESLGLLVEQFLAFAQLRAKRKEIMCMEDWLRKLDQFIGELNEMDVLTSAGSVTRKEMEAKVRKAYEAYRRRQIKEKSISEDELDRRLENAESKMLQNSAK